LWIVLKNRHQLDDRDPEFLQIWDLFHQAGIGAGPRRIYAGVGVLGEALDVKFVDDRVRLGTRLPVSCPVKCRAVTSQRS
jgi:hypothetical protein